MYEITDVTSAIHELRHHTDAMKAVLEDLQEMVKRSAPGIRPSLPFIESLTADVTRHDLAYEDWKRTLNRYWAANPDMKKR